MSISKTEKLQKFARRRVRRVMPGNNGIEAQRAKPRYPAGREKK
jgi:hypothetical protein